MSDRRDIMRGLQAALLLGAFWLTAAAAGGDIGALTKGTPMTAKPSIATTIETEARHAALQGNAGGEMLASTPPFPVAWPPAGETRLLRIYFYHSEPAPTGSVAFDVRPPSQAVTVSVDGDAVSVSQVEQLDGSGDADRQFEMAEPVTDEDLAAATEALLSVLASRDVEGDAAARVRRTYAAWLARNPVIGKAIYPRHKSFMDWLDGD